MTTTREALERIGEKLERLRIEMWACERTPNRHSISLAGILNELGVLAAANAEEAKPSYHITGSGKRVLLPEELAPTHGMLLAGADAIRFDANPFDKMVTAGAVYQAMVAALPAPVDAQQNEWNAAIEAARDCAEHGQRHGIPAYKIAEHITGLKRQSTPVDARPMSDFLIQIRDDAYERAAKVCDGVNNHDNPMTSRDCADAIRAFKGFSVEPPTAKDAQCDRDALIAAIKGEVPLVEPVYIDKALRAGRRAKVVLAGGKGPKAAVHLVNIGLTGWVHTAETAEAFSEGYNRAIDQYRAALIYLMEETSAMKGAANAEQPDVSLTEGQEVSIDVSTGDEDAGNRIFARLTGDCGSDGTWLAEETSRNFKDLADVSIINEGGMRQAEAIPEKIVNSDVGPNAYSKEYAEGWNDCIDDFMLTRDSPPTSSQPVQAEPSAAMPAGQQSMICKTCGADRLKVDCKGDRQNCDVRGTAQQVQPAAQQERSPRVRVSEAIRNKEIADPAYKAGMDQARQRLKDFRAAQPVSGAVGEVEPITIGNSMLYLPASICTQINEALNQVNAPAITAEALLRSVFKRFDLTERARELFFKDLMQGKEELTLNWEDFRMMAAISSTQVNAAQPDKDVEPRLLGLLKEARATLEMWKDVAPAISLCENIDAALSAVNQVNAQKDALRWMERMRQQYSEYSSRRKEIGETPIPFDEYKVNRDRDIDAVIYDRAKWPIDKVNAEKPEKDAELLEWIERKLFHKQWNGVIDGGNRTNWYVAGGHRHITQTMIGDTFRDAIRAAIAAQPAKQDKGDAS